MSQQQQSNQQQQQPPRQSVAASLRNQPLRKSAVGGVMTRQPDYEQRHLEMMRYLASIKHQKEQHSSSSSSSVPSEPSAHHNLPPIYNNNSSNGSNPPIHKRSDYQEEVLRRTHESEVQRLRSSFVAHRGDNKSNNNTTSTATASGNSNVIRRRFKNTINSNSSSPGVGGGENNNQHQYDGSFLPHETEVDPLTGLPRQNISTLNLKNHPGMMTISPWGILYQWLRQTFRSKIVLIVILGFVLMLNFRRFGVLFQIHNNKPTTTNLAQQQKEDGVVVGDKSMNVSSTADTSARMKHAGTKKTKNFKKKN